MKILLGRSKGVGEGFQRKIQNTTIISWASGLEMETEELIRKCQAITLEEEEADKFIFAGEMKEKGSKAVAGCLVGKILLARGVNRKGLKTALDQAWRTVHDFKIESLGSNILFF